MDHVDDAILDPIYLVGCFWKPNWFPFYGNHSISTPPHTHTHTHTHTLF